MPLAYVPRCRAVSHNAQAAMVFMIYLVTHQHPVVSSVSPSLSWLVHTMTTFFGMIKEAVTTV